MYVKTKKNYYILPFPPFAVIVAPVTLSSIIQKIAITPPPFVEINI
jgi:hypothetical protein